MRYLDIRLKNGDVLLSYPMYFSVELFSCTSRKHINVYLGSCTVTLALSLIVAAYWRVLLMYLTISSFDHPISIDNAARLGSMQSRLNPVHPSEPLVCR